MTRIDNARIDPRPARHRAHRQELADRSAAAHADEQSRSRRRRAAGGARRLWRHRPGGARLGELRPHRRGAEARSRRDETLLVQSGKPVGVFRTHADAPRVLIANSNLVPHWATWDHFHELDRKGLMMYGQMTAGSWIYIGTQGIVQGTYETFVEVGRQHYGGDLAGQLDPDRRPRRHGRRAAARRDHGRRLAASPSSASRAASRCGCAPRYLDAQADDLDEALAMIDALVPSRRSRSRSACSATPPRSSPSWCARGVRPDVVTDQTSAHDPLNGYLPDGWTLAEWEERREQRPEGGRARPPSARWRSMSRAMLDFCTRGRADARLRQQHPPDGEGRGRRGRLRLPGLRAGLYPPAVLPRHRPVPLGGAVRRSGGHLPHRRQGEGAAARTTRTCTTGSTWRASASPSRACRRASAGSASATATGSASPSTRWWRAGELKAPIVIGRDHLDSGSVASPEPRDRGDAGRLGRGLRLAAAQRAAQLRLGRDLGVAASWRRRRHGLLAACRHGDRLRRHAGSRAAARARAVERSRRPASCATPMPATRSRSTARGSRG